ncbi:MAG: hypothetical protein Kow0059_15960 [Candidatus Sumerlaeia bacterium]
MLRGIHRTIHRTRELACRVAQARYLPWALAAGLLATSLALANLAFHHDGDITHAIRVGRWFYEREGVAELVRKSRPTLQPENGFDGQFYYYLAHDPLLINPATVRALDAPHLRARRILFPIVARLLVRHRSAIPRGLLLVLLGSVVGTGLVLAGFLKRAGLAPLWVACGVLTVGTAVPVDYLTCEPLGAFLAVAALAAWGCGRMALAWAATAAAVLTKEPAAALAVAFAATAARERRWRRAAVFAGAVVPWAAWALYLKLHLNVPSNPTDMAKNFTLPFQGAFRATLHDWRMLSMGENERVYALRLLARLWFVLAAVVVIAAAVRRPSAAGVLGGLAALNALMLSSGAEAPSFDYLAHFARQLYLLTPALFVMWTERRDRLSAWLLILHVPLALEAWRLLIAGKFI